jgi:hypothetical protein
VTYSVRHAPLIGHHSEELLVPVRALMLNRSLAILDISPRQTVGAEEKELCRDA